jgi:hypothetical protein
MAKNNFKKKKTLKRSLRRNHTKKVASAPLGSRTPNIRKKNRRSQKQRATLRNKRNTRAKVGGAPPSITGAPPSITGAQPSFTDTIMEHLKDGTIDTLLNDQQDRIAEFDIKAELEEEKQRRNAEQYTWDPEREAMRQKEIEEKRLKTERIQSNNYYKIQPQLKYISSEMRKVKNAKEERKLFEAAEKLILSNGLSPSDIEHARNEVLEARNTGAAKNTNWPQMKHWYFTYEYGGTQRTDTYKYYDYDNPPEIIQKTEDKINPLQLSVNSGVASKDPLPGDVPTSNSSNPSSLFSVTQRPIPPVNR